MPTLPSQGGSPGTWGTELNAWLLVGHDSAGNNLGSNAPMRIKVYDDATTITTGDGKVIFGIEPALNGLNLTAIWGYVTTVSSSGIVTVQIRNVTDSQDMLSTKLTIDASEFSSDTAAAAAVIDTAHDDVATGDRIAVDIDVAGTGAKGLGLVLTFA